jgi:hypothetical protein
MRDEEPQSAGWQRRHTQARRPMNKCTGKRLACHHTGNFLATLLDPLPKSLEPLRFTHAPVFAMGSCIHLRSSTLIALSLASAS